MTTITDKVTQYLDHLNVFQDTNGKTLINQSISLLYRILAASYYGERWHARFR